ncbi:MFS transporter [Arthrobacter crusticola]|uniref:MFS transporter n=1 Tax=Arthrobacter crusticola TaxID=2547960 RepID=A0A4R5TSI0_9MICC|nr:MFS transporter [Arthrobacter crusticola]TDK23954.1 MFS transporter [Arthrobacter crusticola]
MKRSLQPQGGAAGPIFTASSVALIAATYGLARLGYGLFLPAFSAAFALTPAIGGLLASGASVTYCISAVLGFRHAPTHPRMVAVLAGMTATGGSAGIAAAPGTTSFVGAVLLAGMGAGFSSPALVELVQRNFKPAERDMLQSVVNSGTGFGVMAAGTFSLVLGSSWRLAWALIAVISFSAMMGVLRADTSRGGSAQGLGPGSRRPPVPGTRHRRAGLRPLRRPITAAVILGIGSSAIWVHGRTLLEGEGGMAVETSAAAWIALGAGGAAAALTSPWLARHAIRTTWPVTVLAVALATGMFGIAPHSTLLSFGAAALFGLAYTAATSVLIIWAARTAESNAAGTSVLFISLVLGQALGATLVGALIGTLEPGPAFIVAAIICGLSALGSPSPATSPRQVPSPVPQ